MDKLDRKYILNSSLKRIASVSDKEYQKRVWIEGRGPECDSYDDCANDFLDEGESILKNYKDFGITNTQYQVLKNFWDEFDAFSASTERAYLPQDFIDSPEWTKITEMAKEVLKTFNWEKPDSGYLC